MSESAPVSYNMDAGVPATADNLTDFDYLNIMFGDISDEDIKQSLLSQFYKNVFGLGTQVALIIAFSVLILFGAIGNGLVCYVVARNPHMRTPRNIFIINLAISDLTLCLFTQPLNLMKLSVSYWPLGEAMCKVVPMFAGTNVFVSTISITAIALDRFQVIVYPTKDSMKKVGAAAALVSIWVISLLMASPLLIFSTLKTDPILPGYHIPLCVERNDLHYGRGAYSIASMVFQYIVPIVIVAVAHARICRKLKYRMVNQQPTNPSTVNSPFQKRKNEREMKRKRKTNLLLVMIAVVFSCSWMPLNVCNIIADFHQELLQSLDPQKGPFVIAICHLLVLSSACTNPVLYGWLNENFRREFVKVLCAHCKTQNINTCCPNTQGAESSMVVYTKGHTNGTTNLEVGQNLEVRTADPLLTSTSNIQAL